MLRAEALCIDVVKNWLRAVGSGLAINVAVRLFGMNKDELCAIFKGLSNRTRLRIVNLLIHTDVKLCVCEIVDSLNEPQYKISKHLRELKFSGMIGEEKVGRWVM